MKSLTVLGLSLAVTLSVAGCKSNTPAANDASTAVASNGPDPAAVNMAPVTGASYTAAPTQGKVLGARSEYNPGQATAEEYPQQQAAPPPNGYPENSYPNGAADPGYDPNYENQVDAGQDALYADQPPPLLPVYDQPEDVNPNDIWTPGYWSYGPGGYYWVPGAWVAAPYTGALWTPGYWGYVNNRYVFHRGYWGLHIGFYGGIPYGFGYTGIGYSGGYWNGSNFYYNRAVNRINVNIVRNVYMHNVTVVNSYNRVSYNGGRGGIPVRPQPAEIAAMHGPRTPPMQAQLQAEHAAAQNRQQFFAQNHGAPAVAVAARPYQADHVAPPANLERVQQENQQRLEQMRAPRQQAQPGPNQPGQNQSGPQQRAGENPAQQRAVPNEQRPNQPAQNQPAQNQQVQHEQQLNQQRTQENAQQQQRVQQENAQRQQQQVQAQQHQRQVEQQQRQQQGNQQRTQENQQQQQRIQQPSPQRVQPRPETPVVRPQVEQRPQPPVQPRALQPAPQQTRPEPQARPAPAPRPEAAPRPAPAPRPAAEPREEGRPRG